MFGAGAQTGTSTYNYTDIKEGNTNTRMMSITVMDQYKTKSFEELRCEDYAKGNKGGASGGFSLGVTGANSEQWDHYHAVYSF